MVSKTTNKPSIKMLVNLFPVFFWGKVCSTQQKILLIRKEYSV